jgi:hypothetical protein
MRFVAGLGGQMPGLQTPASRERPHGRRGDSDVKVKIGMFIPDSFPNAVRAVS